MSGLDLENTADEFVVATLLPVQKFKKQSENIV